VEGTPFGRYRLLSLLGRGGMGEVWRAFDTETNRIVAVKVLPANLADDPQFEQRFRREANAAAGLNDPHIVPIHHFGEIDGRLYVDMRLIEGRDLHSVIAEGPMHPVRAVGIIDHVAATLDAAHKIGLVHRDVKPSNILIAKSDFAYLIDFGIARATDETGMTSSGMVIGTWAYLAPERITGEADHRADIYALACVLYECLAGRQPFPGNSIEQQVGGHLGLAPPRPSALNRAVPTRFDDVIAKGMAKRPDDRYATVGELAHAARQAIAIPSALPPAAPPWYSTEHSTWAAPTAAPPPQTRYGTPPGLVPSEVTQQQRPPGTQWPQQSSSLATTRAGRSRWWAITAGVGVIAVVAALALVFTNRDDRSTSVIPSSSSTVVSPPPNTGPFTGAFTAEIGEMVVGSTGKPVDGAPPPSTETWRVSSACRPSGCVATAATTGQFGVTKMVFDDIGGGWRAVTDAADQAFGHCNDVNVQQFDVVSFQPHPDGTLTGDWTTTNTQGCIHRRTITLKRTGDTDVALLTDPASVLPRVVSPAEALQGRYRLEVHQSNTTGGELDFGVRTDCLRTAARCMSFFVNAENNLVQPLVFSDGRWIRNTFSDNPCPSGGTYHGIYTAEFPLPQPPQIPIATLNGHGRVETTGDSTCHSTDYDETFIRTGD
jgi:serine/threonine protein kinase